MNNQNDISIIILSFNTEHITQTAIEKAKASIAFCQKKLHNSCEIIVVDNYSTDGSVEVLKNQKGIKTIFLSKNIGVAKGYNKGMQMATKPFILLINNDTYLYEDTLYKVLKWMSTHSEADSIVGYTIDGDGQYTFPTGSFPTPFRTIRWMLGVESLPLVKRVIDPIYHKTVFKKERKIDWIATCFFFMRRKVYDLTKGHDEQMFFYMEDVEWCKRIADAGFSIWFTPEIKSVHLGGKSSKSSLKKQFLLQSQFNGMTYYHFKHHKKFFFLVRFFLVVGLKFRALAYALMSDKQLSQVYNAVVVPSFEN